MSQASNKSSPVRGLNVRQLPAARASRRGTGWGQGARTGGLRKVVCASKAPARLLSLVQVRAVAARLLAGPGCLPALRWHCAC